MPADAVPTFHIAVPYVDQADRRHLLASTLESILNQAAVRDDAASLLVTVASATDSRELAEYVADVFPTVELQQGPDSGMYDGLARAFRDLRADFYGWLGAGDTYEPEAFTVVMENAPRDPTHEPYWITGLMRGRRADGAVVRSFLPYRYRKRFFETGLHGTVLPTIQQESTFWDRALQENVDLAVWSTFKLAGDFFLWRAFSQVCEPVVVEAALGAFTWHGDNQSQDYETYQTEVRAITRPARFWERKAASLERMAWALHPAIKTRLAKGRIRRYVWPEGPWRT